MNDAQYKQVTEIIEAIEEAITKFMNSKKNFFDKFELACVLQPRKSILRELDVELEKVQSFEDLECFYDDPETTKEVAEERNARYQVRYYVGRIERLLKKIGD